MNDAPLLQPSHEVPHPSREVFKAQYARVFEAAECGTQVELAALLNVGQAAISDARRRESVPGEWLITLFEKKRINPDWVLRGGSAKYLVPAAPAFP